MRSASQLAARSTPRALKLVGARYIVPSSRDHHTYLPPVAPLGKIGPCSGRSLDRFSAILDRASFFSFVTLACPARASRRRLAWICRVGAGLFTLSKPKGSPPSFFFLSCSGGSSDPFFSLFFSVLRFCTAVPFYPERSRGGGIFDFNSHLAPPRVIPTGVARFSRLPRAKPRVHAVSARRPFLFLVIPTGAAPFFLRAGFWRAGPRSGGTSLRLWRHHCLMWRRPFAYFASRYFEAPNILPTSLSVFQFSMTCLAFSSSMSSFHFA